jgi:ribose-phosphate pyrophosphokinase
MNDTHAWLDAAEHLKRCEASKVVLVATHGILGDDGLRQVNECSAVDEVSSIITT